MDSHILSRTQLFLIRGKDVGRAGYVVGFIHLFNIHAKTYVQLHIFRNKSKLNFDKAKKKENIIELI